MCVLGGGLPLLENQSWHTHTHTFIHLSRFREESEALGNRRCALFAPSPLQGPPLAPPVAHVGSGVCLHRQRVSSAGGWGRGEALSVVEDACRALKSAQGLHLHASSSFTSARLD